MDPYERLTAINETLMGKIKSLFKGKPKETPVQMFSRMVADLDKKYPDLPENQPPKTNRPFKKVGPVKFHPGKKKSIGESTEKIDQEFGAAKKALKDAGIKFKALQAIGSLDREKNTFNIPREDMRKARQVLKNFPNAQIKRA